MELAFSGDFSTYRVPSLSLWLFPVRFLCPLGFPSVRPPHAPLLGLSRICHCVLLVPLLRDSVESQFLRDGVLPTGRVSSVSGFVPSFSWFRFLSASLGVLSLLFSFLSFLLLVVWVSLCFVGSSLGHMISLSFHTIIFQRKEWGKAMINLSLILLWVFFITERRTTESTWSACPSILLYFKEKNEGKLWSVSPLYYCFFKNRTTESTWSTCPSILLYFKEKNEGKLWSVSPLYYCGFFL